MARNIGLLMRRFIQGDGCWVWEGYVARDGYGRYGIDGGLAHRQVYEVLVGPIPEGTTLDHLCRRRDCVNPSHLEAVPLRTNILRGENPPAKTLARLIVVVGMN